MTPEPPAGSWRIPAAPGAAPGSAPPGADPTGPVPDSSEQRYDGRIVGLTLEQWGPHLREVVEHRGAVTVVAVDRDDCVLLVRQLREVTRRRLLEIPAGGMGLDEDPLACARRELAEETQHTGGTWTYATTFWTTPGFSRELMWLYFAEGVEPAATHTPPDDDEDLELVRVPLAEVPALLPGIADLKTLAGLLLYLRHRGR